MAKKQAKKSVKFTSAQTLQSPSVKDLKTDEIVLPPVNSEDSDSESQGWHRNINHSSSSSKDTINFRFQLKTLPVVQFLGFGISLYQDYTTTEKIQRFLILQNSMMTIWQLIYGTFFISSITVITHPSSSATTTTTSSSSSKKSTPSKHKHIKFQLVKDWPLFPLAMTLALIPLIPATYILLVLFGAPFNLSYFNGNLLLSWHVVNMVLPYLLTYLKVGKVSQGALFQLTLVVLGGCWLGAVVVPLDWDRPWQTWPLPIVFGGYIGGVVSGLVAGLGLV